MTRISEMETVMGGKTVVSPCADSLIGMGLDAVALGFTIAGIGSGPIGWGVMALVYGGIFAGGIDGMFIFKNCF